MQCIEVLAGYRCLLVQQDDYKLDSNDEKLPVLTVQYCKRN